MYHSRRREAVQLRKNASGHGSGGTNVSGNSLLDEPLQTDMLVVGC